MRSAEDAQESVPPRQPAAGRDQRYGGAAAILLLIALVAYYLRAKGTRTAGLRVARTGEATAPGRREDAPRSDPSWASPSHSKPGFALALLCTAQVVLQLDFSIVNVALRTIERSLAFGASELQWIVTGYALAFGSLLLLGGRLGDHLGRRRLLVGGLWLFGLASLACGLARSPEMLVAARLIQGAGAALMAPTILATLTAIYPDGVARTHALGIWTAATAVGASSGVVAGGLLTQYLGWRSIFLVNLPVIAVLIPLCYAVLPNLPGEQRERGLDVPGASLVTLALAALIFALSEGAEHGFGAVTAVGGFAVCALAAVLFVFAEAHAAAPMVPRAFIAVRLRRVSTLVMAVVGGSLTANAYFLALYEQRTLHFSQAHAAVGLLPGPLTIMAVSSQITRRLIARIGLKPVVVIGLVALAAAYACFSAAGAGGDYWQKVFPVLVLNACGGGLLFPAASIAITQGTDATNRGLAGSVIPTAQQIGAAVWLAVLATIAASTHGSAVSPIAHCSAAYWVAAAIALLAAGLVLRTSFTVPTQGVAAVVPAAAGA